LNVSEFDSFKHNALALVGDAKVNLEALQQSLAGYCTSADYRQRIRKFPLEWETEVERIYCAEPSNPALSQGEVIGILNTFSRPQDVVVCAAGSLPGDLHKLWRTRDSKGYHVEYGFSCMGYEIAAGLGIKMASPEREVYVMVGDGSYLMMAQELVTAVQEGIKFTVLLLDNHGYASIGALSTSLGSAGFGTRYRYRGNDGQLSGDVLPVDFAGNAQSLGAAVLTARTRDELSSALECAKKEQRPTVIVVATDTSRKVGGYESWWDVPVAEVSTIPSVRMARKNYEDKSAMETKYYSPLDNEPSALQCIKKR
jgi:3D-(3,5/4)-trihydroxycyclohexane-1,2-dione acylhydrolase (decyclizing)